MTNNDLFRRLRYLLNYSDEKMSAVFAMERFTVSPQKVAAYLKKEDEPEYLEMDDGSLGFFLDGLISTMRGKRDSGPGQSAERRIVPRTNNECLKKLRIAFNLKEEEMLEIFALGEMPISKSELSAFFRNKQHRNYTLLGDQAFRKFLNGLLEFRNRAAGKQ